MIVTLCPVTIVNCQRSKVPYQTLTKTHPVAAPNAPTARALIIPTRLPLHNLTGVAPLKLIYVGVGVLPEPSNPSPPVPPPVKLAPLG